MLHVIPGNPVFETLSEKIVFKGRLITVVLKKLRGRKGVFNAELVVHPGAVVILPLKENRKIVFVKQYRHGAEEELLELPAGTLEEGENPEECALRELEEETGYKASEIKLLGMHYASPGYSTEVFYSFVASGLKKGTQKLEIDEDISIVEYDMKDVLKLVKDNVIRDSKTLATLALYLIKHGAMRF